MQLHPFELYSLIELVEPGLYPTFDAYEQRRADLPKLNSVMRVLKEWKVLDENTRSALLVSTPPCSRSLFEGVAPDSLDDPGFAARSWTVWSNVIRSPVRSYAIARPKSAASCRGGAAHRRAVAR